MTQKKMHDKAMEKIEGMEMRILHAQTIEELRINRSRAKGAVDLAYELGIIEKEESERLYEIIMGIFNKKMDQIERW